MKHVLAMALVLGTLFGAQAALAITVAGQMTCDKAISYYETHKRIYVQTRTGDILPLYGFTPVNKWRTLNCQKRNSGRANYWVGTLDNDTCVIGVYCK